MKVRIDTDEWRPCHSITTDTYSPECDVPDETIERWNRIMEEFDVMQKEMEDAIRESIAKRPASNHPPYKVDVQFSRDSIEIQTAEKP